MRFKAVIFDLDGTLLNSLVDIAEAVNTVLKQYGYPLHSFDDYKKMIGSGLQNLVKSALPSSIEEDELLRFYDKARQAYAKGQTNRSYPYEGIMPMLKTLNENGVLTAILSNKPHAFTQTIVRHYFPEIRFEKVLGLREGIPRKPNPEAVFEILNTFALDKKEVVFVGDSATDILTAKNAGLTSIGVSWGYRSVEELAQAGADYIVHTPSELEAVLK